MPDPVPLADRAPEAVLDGPAAILPTISPVTAQPGPITPAFVLAGRAVFTVSNPHGERYTYRISRKDPEAGSRYEKFGPSYFAALLTGPDNTADYTYLGMVRDDLTVRLTRASHYAADSKPVKVLAWALRVVGGTQKLPPGYAIHHA